MFVILSERVLQKSRILAINIDVLPYSIQSYPLSLLTFLTCFSAVESTVSKQLR